MSAIASSLARAIPSTAIRGTRSFLTSQTCSDAAPVRSKGAFTAASEDDLKRMPGVLFTTSAMVISSLVAVGVAGVGLVGMSMVGSYINDTFKRKRQEPDAAAVAERKKSLTELIIERKAELELELAELQRSPTPSPEVKGQVAAVRRELSQYRPHGSRTWWQLW